MASKLCEGSQTELYLKGIYPVELVASADKGEVTVRVKRRFLHSSNYSDEKRWVKPGEILKVPARIVWSHQRGVARGHR
jgi:hypothetical protein